MNTAWLARFANEPVLVASHLNDRFRSSLLELGERESAELAAAQGQGDDFWTELGPVGTKRLRPYVVENGVLLVQVKGVLLNGFPYQFFSLATGYEYLARVMARGLADDDVKGIALVIDSPGGMVAGNFDLVDRIHAARGTKPIRSFAMEAAYSAAYSIASAADRIVVARTGGVGSIGVVTAHVDFSRALEEDGVKVTFIFAGKHKVDGNPYEVLPDDVKARIQERIDHIYGIFVDTVARNRNLDAAAVRATEALTFAATEAIANGLADDVGALDDALAQFAADLTNPNQGDETMTDKVVTVASVKADHPEIAAALIAEGKTLGKTEGTSESEAALPGKIDAAVNDAVTKDRARVAGLDALLAQLGGVPKAVEIVSAAKADGSAVDATKVKLFDAGVMQSAAALNGLKGDDASALAAKPAPGEAAPVAQTAEGWEGEWKASAELQANYPTAKHYVRFKEYEARKNPKKEG